MSALSCFALFFFLNGICMAVGGGEKSVEYGFVLVVILKLPEATVKPAEVARGKTFPLLAFPHLVVF